MRPWPSFEIQNLKNVCILKKLFLILMTTTYNSHPPPPPYQQHQQQHNNNNTTITTTQDDHQIKYVQSMEIDPDGIMWVIDSSILNNLAPSGYQYFSPQVCFSIHFSIIYKIINTYVSSRYIIQPMYNGPLSLPLPPPPPSLPPPSPPLSSSLLI